MSNQRRRYSDVKEPQFGWTDVLVEYVDMRELEERGWTRRMVKLLLGPEDTRGPVDHWRNFAGKLLYQRVRVAKAEGTPEFRLNFKKSLRGASLSEPWVKQVLRRSHLFEALTKTEEHGRPPKRDGGRLPMP